MNPVALPGDQPVFVPGSGDGGRPRASVPQTAALRPVWRLAGAAAVGAIGGAMFGAVLMVAAVRGNGGGTLVLPEVNTNVRYAYRAEPASFSGGVQGVSMLVMPLTGERGRHLSLVVDPERVRASAETDLTFDVRVIDLAGAPLGGATVRAELLVLPWMDRSAPSAVTADDGRAKFEFPGLTRAGSYELRIVDVSLDGERFVPPPDQDRISVPVPGAD
jgi:hypothetical protein